MKKAIILLGLGVICFTACRKQKADFQSKQIPATMESWVISKDEKENLADEFGKILSLAVNANSNLRQFIKSQILLQFDGHYDFIFQKLANMPIQGEDKTFTGCLRESSGLSDSQFQGFMDSISNYLPLLQVAMLSTNNNGIINWDVSNFVPKAAIWVNDTNALNVKIYNDGIKNTQPIDYIPENPILVVSESNRVFAFPIGQENRFGTISNDGDLTIVGDEGTGITITPFFVTNDYSYFLGTKIFTANNSIILGGGGVPPLGPDPNPNPNPTPSPNCYRDTHAGIDKLKDIKFKNCRKFHQACGSFLSGSPALRVKVLAAGLPAPLTIVMNPSRGQLRDKNWHLGCDHTTVYDPDMDLFTWDKNINGTQIMMVWYIHHSGKTITLSNSFSNKIGNTTTTTTVSATFTDNDKMLGDVVAEYCQPNNHKYSNSYLSFYVKR